MIKNYMLYVPVMEPSVDIGRTRDEFVRNRNRDGQETTLSDDILPYKTNEENGPANQAVCSSCKSVQI